MRCCQTSCAPPTRWYRIRADFDTGSVIVKDMFERLAFADLVVADVSLPNGNVYYEVGLRHVAREAGCIMLAATWSRQLFDIEQFTSVRYELADGDVPDADAEAIRAIVRESISSLKNSRTPWFEFIPDPGDEQARKFATKAEDRTHHMPRAAISKRLGCKFNLDAFAAFQLAMKRIQGISTVYFESEMMKSDDVLSIERDRSCRVFCLPQSDQ